MYVHTTFADNSNHTYIMIDRLSMDDIDAGSGIRVMSLAVANEMTEGHSAESG